MKGRVSKNLQTYFQTTAEEMEGQPGVGSWSLSRIRRAHTQRGNLAWVVRAPAGRRRHHVAETDWHGKFECKCV